MLVTLQLDAEAASALRARTHDPRTDELLHALRELDVRLDPIDRDATSDDGWFVAEVDDPDEAERVIARLGSHRGVQAIYVKPPDEEP